MAEFTDIMEQVRRMCKARRDCGRCALYRVHTGGGCAFDYLPGGVSFDEVEYKVDAWAEKHPDGDKPERPADAEPVRHGHWISVQERLPGNLEKCLTFSPENGIRIGCYTEVGFILSNFGGAPTHWMPMPEPPKHDVDGDGA